MEIKIRQHPTSETHWISIVTTKALREYFLTWADEPTQQMVADAWRYERRSFLPYQGY